MPFTYSLYFLPSSSSSPSPSSFFSICRSLCFFFHLGFSYLHSLVLKLSKISMASCGLGASNVKIPTLNFNQIRIPNLQKWNDVIPLIGQRPPKCTSLTISRPLMKPFTVHCVEAGTKLVNDAEETKSSGLTSPLIPSSYKVESLVTEICNTTSIAEFELKLGGFRLYVMRNLTEKSVPSPAPNSVPVLITSTIESSDSNELVSAPSLAITKTTFPSEAVQNLPMLLDKAADEGLVILQSPKVGFFRRSRTIKGKRAPPACKEKQTVKEGQVICYVEQLGAEIPIESDISGEVVKILREDGEPVGYNDALIAILPSFPGIKKLQ
ncbi:uncharacterized protein LOC110825878 isoform X2 [Carica papaya]|uniref:uncharacterized protein LOC110825878 isoform X2 n=1 Tax=Carica papaya TaxID=3649 RepID=UPI000B8CA2C6|nr:uncharacterized protein LOC110825878 isoform X2 [Carica papaya]